MPWHGLGILDIMNKTEFTVCSALLLSLFNCVQLCDPIDGSPPRLPHPWDSPGKNTGVGCHFLLQCMKVKSKSEVAQSRPTLSDPMDCSLPGSSVHGFVQARILEWIAITFILEWLKSETLHHYMLVRMWSNKEVLWNA